MNLRLKHALLTPGLLHPGSTLQSLYAEVSTDLCDRLCMPLTSGQLLELPVRKNNTFHEVERQLETQWLDSAFTTPLIRQGAKQSKVQACFAIHVWCSTPV